MWTCDDWSPTERIINEGNNRHNDVDNEDDTITHKNVISTVDDRVWRPIQQNALIKFVLCTSTTLRWFQSDLTNENG